MKALQKQAIINMLNDKCSGCLDAISLSGSYAAGLATEKSDVDLVILIHQKSKHENKIGNFLVDQIDDKILESLVVDRKFISNLISDSTSQNYSSLNPNDIKLMEWVFSAVPLTGNGVWMDALSEFDRSNYRQKLSKYHQGIAISHFDDFVGEIFAEDYISAIFRLRGFMYHLTEALLSLYGDTNGRQKWILKRLKREMAIEQNIKDDFFKYFLRIHGENKAELIGWIIQCLRLTQKINYETLSYAIPFVKRVDECSGPLFICRDGLFVVSLETGFYVKTMEDRFAIDELTALILANCHRLTSAETLLKIAISSNFITASQHRDVSDRLSELIELRIVLSLGEYETNKRNLNHLAI